MIRALLAATVYLFAAPAAAQEAEPAYLAALDAHIKCASQYVANGLWHEWDATAGDLADSAIAHCSEKLKAYEHAVTVDKDLQLDFEQVRRASAEHVYALRLTLVKHIIEKRNPKSVGLPF